MKTKKEKIIELMNRYDSGTIAKKIGTTKRYVDNVIHKFRNDPQAIVDKMLSQKQIEDDKQRRADKINQSILQKKYSSLLDENELLKNKIDSILSIPSISTYTIEPQTPTQDNEATAIVLASDWHIGEIVRKQQVNGLNEYNLDIATHRINEFFAVTVRMVHIFSRDIPIKNIVLALLGDMINNYLHDDARETNSVPPMEEVRIAQDMICSGIEYILEHTDCTLIIPCKSGNHARISHKSRVANEQGLSLEYLMYCNIANYFKNNDRVHCIIEESYHTIINVYDVRLRLHHGHQIKYQGGVGGITIPANKAIAQWNKSINVNIDCFGHYHTFFDGQNFVLNGSIVGFNAFAVSIKASYERPKQCLFLIDKKRGKTITAPILFTK